MTAVRVVCVVVVAAVVLRGGARMRWWPRVRLSHRWSSTAARPVAPWLEAVAVDAGVPPARARAVWLAVGPVALAAAGAAGSVWPLVLGAVAVGAPWWARGPLRRRTERQIDNDLPGAVEAVARSLRSGASLRQALADAAGEAPGRLGADLRRLVASAGAGIPLEEALQAWARSCPRPGVHLVAAALVLAAETGGATAQAVEGVAATLRRRQSAAEEALALSAQARASAVVLASAPVAVCAFTVVSGGPSARFLLGTSVGGVCLAAGLALDVVGWWWMTKLMGAAVDT